MLRPRQHETLSFLASHTRRYGHAPSFEEIAEIPFLMEWRA